MGKGIASRETLDRVPLADAPRLLYLEFDDKESHRIRSWSHEPFEGAAAYAFAGSGAPLGPHDSSEHCPADQLSFALRSISENIYVQCAPHVLEDMVRIITDSASLIESLTGPPALTRLEIAAREIRDAALEEAAKVAIHNSNFGHVEGNRRAFKIADEIKGRMAKLKKRGA